MAFYLGNLEINFIGMGDMKRSSKSSVIVGVLPLYDPPNGATYFRPWLHVCSSHDESERVISILGYLDYVKRHHKSEMSVQKGICWC